MSARQVAEVRRPAGFSLIELVVVMALIAIMMSFAGVSFYRSLDSVKIRRAGKDVMTALRYTRGQAILTRKESALEVDIKNKTYQAPDKDIIHLPQGVEVTLKTARADIVSEDKGRVRFFPDGSSTGARLTLTAGNREWRITVGWLTGEIAIEDSAEASS